MLFQARLVIFLLAFTNLSVQRDFYLRGENFCSGTIYNNKPPGNSTTFGGECGKLDEYEYDITISWTGDWYQWNTKYTIPPQLTLTVFWIDYSKRVFRPIEGCCNISQGMSCSTPLCGKTLRKGLHLGNSFCLYRTHLDLPRLCREDPTTIQPVTRPVFPCIFIPIPHSKLLYKFANSSISITNNTKCEYGYAATNGDDYVNKILNSTRVHTFHLDREHVEKNGDLVNGNRNGLRVRYAMNGYLLRRDDGLHVESSDGEKFPITESNLNDASYADTCKISCQVFENINSAKQLSEKAVCIDIGRAGPLVCIPLYLKLIVASAVIMAATLVILAMRSCLLRVKLFLEPEKKTCDSVHIMFSQHSKVKYEDDGDLEEFVPLTDSDKPLPKTTLNSDENEGSPLYVHATPMSDQQPSDTISIQARNETSATTTYGTRVAESDQVNNGAANQHDSGISDTDAHCIGRTDCDGISGSVGLSRTSKVESPDNREGCMVTADPPYLTEDAFLPIQVSAVCDEICKFPPTASESTKRSSSSAITPRIPSDNPCDVPISPMNSGCYLPATAFGDR